MLGSIIDSVGFRSRITSDVEGGAAELAGGGYDLLTLYCLRWQMLDPRFEAHRDRWGMRLSNAARAAIRDHVLLGGGLLAVHTAALCFDDWQEYKSLIGGIWRWGSSRHPPLGEATVGEFVEDHPLTEGLSSFDLIDEVYRNLEFEPDVRPLAMAKSSSDVEWHPILWAREVGKGRVVCDLLGHDARSLEQPVHRAVLERAAMWTGMATAEALS